MHYDIMKWNIEPRIHSCHKAICVNFFVLSSQKEKLEELIRQTVDSELQSKR